MLSLPHLVAQINYDNVNPCPLGSGISCLGSGDANTYIRNFLFGPQGVKVAFAGLLFGMLLFYGIRLLIGSRSENVVTETKQAYGQALFGAIIVGGAVFLANTFATTTGQVVVASQFNTVAMNVIFFFSGLVATLVLANVVVQGIRLVISMQEGDMDKAKKGFLHAIIGAGIALLALPIVRTFTAVNTAGGGGVTYGGIPGFLIQVVGIGQYVALILGALSVFGIIIAGIMLVLSIDEGLKDRARKLITTSLIALTIALLSYGIATVFIPPSP